MSAVSFRPICVECGEKQIVRIMNTDILSDCQLAKTNELLTTAAWAKEKYIHLESFDGETSSVNTLVWSSSGVRSRQNIAGYHVTTWAAFTFYTKYRHKTALPCSESADCNNLIGCCCLRLFQTRILNILGTQYGIFSSFCTRWIWAGGRLIWDLSIAIFISV